MHRFLHLPLLIWTVAPALAETTVEFNRDIRPILTKECTACHGGVKAAGGISFIYRDIALGEGDSGKRAIVPGKPEASEMMRRIRSTDPDEVMPKPKHGSPLEEHEIKLIEAWISQGAEWQEHWAFVPPSAVTVEQVSDESWPQVPLDRFILQRLDREGLAPSPAAAPEEWMRRVSFDLTGLPPTLDQLNAFTTALKVNPDTAYEVVADQLLASASFGERWATVWLDLARYSDSYGFEKDPNRTIWPYRDWVIRAFNADMPYDQFTIEQLAGDLLPNATADQRLATAFHRNTQTNTEGGTDDEEFRVAAVLDRVSTTWTTWQATTFGCVQCHAHPYDPIEHDEFYQFVAFFNNSEDHDLDGDYPRMKVPSDPRHAEVASRMQVELRDLRHALNASGRALAMDEDQWRPFIPDQFDPSHGELALTDQGSIRSMGTLPVKAIHRVSGPATDFHALWLQILPDSNDPSQWPERGSLVTKLEVRLIDDAGKVEVVDMKEVFADQLGGFRQVHPGGNVGAYPKLHGPRWFVFVPEQPVKSQPGMRMEVVMNQNERTAGQQATPVRHFAIGTSTRPQWRELVHAPERLTLWAEHDQLKERYQAIEGVRVPIMVEGPQRETRVFARGNRLNKEHAVQPGIPKLFGGQVGEGMNRLDMARWIVSEDNPLTSRVMVNRLWGEVFGVGIVKTAEDFGTSGTRPSHPELLDHLALRFQDDFGWSVKRLLKEIVLSSTYRQTHRASKELVIRDPENRLLARGPRNRLTAEMVRDQALSVAGLLSDKMLGPPVFPPQPDGVWKSVYSGAKWTESKGEDRLRRAIYTYNKRTSGFPGFLMFDAPSRDLCSARRIVSNTPLQALVTLNDPAHIEAAQGLAKRMMEHSNEPTEQHRFAMMLATQRDAAPEVLAELALLREDALAQYRDDLDAAQKLGETPDEAALVLVANTVLNLDASLTK